MASQMLNQVTRIFRDEHGGPHLPKVLERISISHTGDHMGILVSKSRLLALDIELIDRDIERIIPRFTHPNEIDLYKRVDCINPALFVWGVKECLFKAVPVQGILFKEHLIIDAVESSEGTISHCSIHHPELTAHLTVVSRIFGPLIVSYIDQLNYGHEQI